VRYLYDLFYFIYMTYFIGRQNIENGMTKLLETVKNTKSSSDSSMMLSLSAQELARKAEMDERRRERELEMEEHRKDREVFFYFFISSYNNISDYGVGVSFDGSCSNGIGSSKGSCSH